VKSLSLNVIACKFTLKNGPITVGHPFRHCGLDQGDCGSVPAMTEKAAPLPSMASPFVIAGLTKEIAGRCPQWQPPLTLNQKKKSVDQGSKVTQTGR